MFDNQNLYDNNEENLSSEEKKRELQEFSRKQKEGEKKTRTIIMAIGIIILICAYWFIKTVIIREFVARGHVFNGIAGLADASKSLYKTGSLNDGRANDALAFFDKAISMDSWFADPYYLKGITYYYKYINGRNNKEENQILENYLKNMEENLKKAINCNFDYPEAHAYLGYYYYEKKEYDKAVNELDRTIDSANKIWKDSQNKRDKWISFAMDGKDKIKNNNFSGLEPPKANELK